jgi:hypothetical protein
MESHVALHDLKWAGDGMQKLRSLKNPLGVCRTIVSLEQGLLAQGLTTAVSNDMAEFASVKRAVRKLDPAPMHDHAVCDFSQDRAFWMSLTDRTGKIVGIQAYRCDRMDVSLSEWCTNYMIGVYMRRNELMVPSHARPPQGSVAEKLTGTLAYHGELWVDREIKNRRVVEFFSRLGSLITLCKWNPDAIWALTGFHMATRGYASRMGYPYIERGFLRWLWHSDNVEDVEYLAVAERSFLEQIVEESLEAKDGLLADTAEN